MASIIKRKKSYSVVYSYTDENGEAKQKWETWHTHKEALKRKAEIENLQNTGTFITPSNQKDIYHIFTPLMPNTSTRLVLKKPKTDSSIRKVWLPKTVAYILRDWKKSQDELKGFLGDDYQDNDLVVALQNGRPCERRIINKAFDALKSSAKLPNVVFHSLRHSSTTYKLKLNHGDLKANQGDTGHAEIDMITKVYAHILDEDRKINAQKFESAFYSVE